MKEYYFYLDATPTCSYAKALYKYPQAEFPYARLVDENRRRGRTQPEFELIETGIFNDGRYFDVQVEYAKAGPNDILIRLRLANRGPEPARLHVLPTLWLRNTWSWGCEHDGCWPRGRLEPHGDSQIDVTHPSLGHFVFDAGPSPARASRLRCSSPNNETNFERLFGYAESRRPTSRTPSTATSSRARPGRGQSRAVSAPRPPSITCSKFRPAAS